MVVISLENSIRTLKELLSGDVISKKQIRAEQATQLFLSSLHLLCELKKDASLLQRLGYEYDDRCPSQMITFPPELDCTHITFFSRVA
jgi:hypothetical protein